MTERSDPLVSYHFYVDIGDKGNGVFREASGLDSETEVIEHKESGPKGEVLTTKLPGRTKYPNIVLKRGLTGDTRFWEWRKQIEEGKFKEAMTNGSIVLYDQTHAEVARWNFEEGWAAKVSGPQLNATTNEVAVETVEIAVARTIRVK